MRASEEETREKKNAVGLADAGVVLGGTKRAEAAAQRLPVAIAAAAAPSADGEFTAMSRDPHARHRAEKNCGMPNARTVVAPGATNAPQIGEAVTSKDAARAVVPEGAAG